MRPAAAPVESARPGVHADRAGPAARRSDRTASSPSPTVARRSTPRRKATSRSRPSPDPSSCTPTSPEPTGASRRSTTATTPASTISSSAGRSSSTSSASRGSRGGPQRKVAARASSLNCPACGAGLQLKDPANTVRVACTYCGSVLATPEAGAVGGEVRGPRPAPEGPVQAAPPARGGGDAPGARLRDPRRDPEGLHRRRDVLLLARVPPQGDEVARPTTGSSSRTGTGRS